LESYQEILGVLVEKPLDVDSLSYELSGNCAIVKQRLNFLVRNCLVEKRSMDKGTVYAATERGAAVLRALNVQTRLERLKDAIITVSER